KAGEAVGKTQNDIDKEQALADGKIEIDGNLYNSIDDYIEGKVAMFPYAETAKDENGCVTVNATYESDGLVAVIPQGFKVSETTGETSIATGLVIKDAEGNEFVWVPCTTDANDGSGLTLYAQDKKYNDGTVASKQGGYKDYSDWKDEGGNARSVKKYGGFYVGRYEAGIPTNVPFSPFYENSDEKKYTYSGRNTTEYIPVSKPNNPSWNGISQEKAKTVSKAMYKDSTSVESSLIDSYAWDTIVNWMESKNTGIATNSTSYGNYLNSSMSLTNALYATHVYQYEPSWKWKTTASNYQTGALEITERSYTGEQTLYELATGTTTNTKVLNIYDMAGNMWEWTTEVGHHDAGAEAQEYAVRRGGGFHYYGNSYPVSYRNGYDLSSYTFYSVGFRVALYIK
ncbi:MAG: SUMF1/EgtB/PvdO family nonheme iron enzyme, partial [Clostridia bacterium]